MENTLARVRGAAQIAFIVLAAFPLYAWTLRQTAAVPERDA